LSDEVVSFVLDMHIKVEETLLIERFEAFTCSLFVKKKEMTLFVGQTHTVTLNIDPREI
jgi:hypothetical protein